MRWGLSLGLLVLAAACARQPVVEPIVIGQLAPQGGPDKAVGERAEQGVRLAVEEADKEDRGIAGRHVVAVQADTRGEAEVAGAVAVRLVRVDRVAGVVGAIDAATAAAAVKALQPYALPFVTSAALPSPLVGDNVYSVGLAPAALGQALARYAVQDLPPMRFAVLADNRPFSAELKEGFAQALAQANRPRPDEWTYQAQADFPDLVARIKKVEPRAVLLVTSAHDFVTLRGLLEKAGVEGQFLFGGEEVAATALLADREASRNLCLATAFLASAAGPSSQEFVQKYQERFQAAPDVHAALAFDSASVLFEAMRQSSSTEGAKMREVLAGRGEGGQAFVCAGVTGPLSFGKDHYARRPVFVVRNDDGQLKLARRFDPPEQIAATK